MAKVGRFVTDPRSGSYCHITLDSGEKIIVSHEENRLAIELSKLLGFASGSVCVCHLDTALGALVKYIKHCGTVADVKARCDVLTPLEEPRP